MSKTKKVTLTKPERDWLTIKAARYMLASADLVEKEKLQQASGKALDKVAAVESDDDVEIEFTTAEAKALREFNKPSLALIENVIKTAENVLVSEGDLVVRAQYKEKIEKTNFVHKMLVGLQDKLK